MTEEIATATVGTKGQIVIPQQMRKELSIVPKTKLAVYKRGDKLVLAKLEVPPLGEQLKSLFIEIDENRRGGRKMSEREILAEVQMYRKEKRSPKVA